MSYIGGLLYINLSHREDRKEALVPHLQNLSQTGLCSSMRRIEGVYDPLNGHRGCALSHLKALTYAKEAGWQNVLILEDDFLPCREAKVITNNIRFLIDSLKDEWDVLLVGGNVISFKKGPLPGIFRVLEAQCAHGYIVNQSYFESLISCFRKAYEEMKEDIFYFDSLPKAIDQAWKALQLKDRWYFKEVMAQQADSFSDIMAQRRSRVHRELFI